MSLNDFGELYNSLFGFGMTIIVDVLKWENQWLNSRQVLVILMMPFKYVLSLIMLLRCLYESLSRSGVNVLLHLVIELMNSSSEKGTQVNNMENVI